MLTAADPGGVGLVVRLGRFGEIDRVPVFASPLASESGNGTNYLLVAGSDSREAVVDAGSADPNVQAGGEAPGGQRSDTMLVLRTTPDGAKLLSVPRDLFVTLPERQPRPHQRRVQRRAGGAHRDRSRPNLGIPINRYVEVDFVTFSGLVDALGGITISVAFPRSSRA